MTRGERDQITDGCLLTVPRTVFDQVLQDMGETDGKTIKDRAKAKTKSSGSMKRLAGFPQFRKWRFPSSVRLQVSAAKNKEFARALGSWKAICAASWTIALSRSGLCVAQHTAGDDHGFQGCGRPVPHHPLVR